MNLANHHSESFEFDLVVIGSGPAGINAAVQAAKLKKKVCIVEASPNKTGGAWIHWGTLPSKTLRETLETIHSIAHHAGQTWVDRILDDLHTEKLLERSRKVSQQHQKVVEGFLEKNKIPIIKGVGQIESNHQVRIHQVQGSEKILTTKYILIATGSRPRRPSNIPFDGWRIVDGDEILTMKCFPRSMVIFGGGVIGCEYACIFNSLGIDVTIIDQRSDILRFFDREIVGEISQSMEKRGIKFRLGFEVSQLKVDGPQVRFHCGSDDMTTECFFFCAGRTPTTAGLGLERLGIETSDYGHVKVNSDFQTSISHIYAAGDVIGAPALAATSIAQGRHVAGHAFGASLGKFPELFPYGVYTIPEMSMVGKTEQDLQREGISYVIGRAHYREIARGYIRGDSEGLIKILFDRKDQSLLGVHIAGADACNLVHIGQALMLKKGRAQDLLDMVFNYPTLTEGYRIAAFNALNKIFTEGSIHEYDKLNDVA
jgi:NAD(P) transhydrogenase